MNNPEQHSGTLTPAQKAFQEALIAMYERGELEDAAMLAHMILNGPGDIHDDLLALATAVYSDEEVRNQAPSGMQTDNTLQADPAVERSFAQLDG